MGKEIVLTNEELTENKLLNDAIAFAVEKHKNGLRKGTKMPYIVHPLEVMHNLMLMGADKNLMAAGVLHDTVEDTDATLEEIAEKFGDDVAALVSSHTEKYKNAPWKIRKRVALEHLKLANKREQMLVLADKLSNMRAIERDYDEFGDKLWERFNRGKNSQSWYYHEGAASLAKLEGYEDTKALYKEFADLVDKVFPSYNNTNSNELNNTTKCKVSQDKANYAGFGMDGYWVKRYIDGTIGMVLKVMNGYDMYVYQKGEWVLSKAKKMYPLGWDDDWDYVSKEEAMKAIEELEQYKKNKASVK